MAISDISFDWGGSDLSTTHTQTHTYTTALPHLHYRIFQALTITVLSFPSVLISCFVFSVFGCLSPRFPPVFSCSCAPPLPTFFLHTCLASAHQLCPVPGVFPRLYAPSLLSSLPHQFPLTCVSPPLSIPSLVQFVFQSCHQLSFCGVVCCVCPFLLVFWMNVHAPSWMPTVSCVSAHLLRPQNFSPVFNF